MFHAQLIAERDAKYKGAWRITGEWIASNTQLLEALETESFCVVMIQNKIVRAEACPDYRDNYDDIIGYATLALQCDMPNKRREVYYSFIELAHRALRILATSAEANTELASEEKNGEEVRI